MTDEEVIWLWRAWNKDRERICDCGVVRAATEEAARGIAWQCIGGPYMQSIVNIEVSKVTRSGYEVSKAPQAPRERFTEDATVTAIANWLHRQAAIQPLPGETWSTSVGCMANGVLDGDWKPK